MFDINDVVSERRTCADAYCRDKTHSQDVLAWVHDRLLMKRLNEEYRRR
jgi:hypothetical protein